MLLHKNSLSYRIMMACTISHLAGSLSSGRQEVRIENLWLRWSCLFSSFSRALINIHPITPQIPQSIASFLLRTHFISFPQAIFQELWSRTYFPIPIISSTQNVILKCYSRNACLWPDLCLHLIKDLLLLKNGEADILYCAQEKLDNILRTGTVLQENSRLSHSVLNIPV